MVSDQTHADFQSVPYVSMALYVVMLQWPAKARQQPPEAFGYCRKADGCAEHQIVYRLTGEVLSWILCKAETTDQKWMAAMRPGAKGVPQKTQEAMRVLADKLQGVLALARELGIVAVKPQTTPSGRQKDPQLSEAPLSLQELQHLAWRESPAIGRFLWKKSSAGNEETR